MRIAKKNIAKLLVLTLLTVLFINFNNITNVFANEDSFTIINDHSTGDGINQFKYNGPWGTSTGHNQFYNSDEHWSNAKNWGSTNYEDINFTVKFFGKKIELYGNKQQGLGIYAVYIDGEETGEIDAYNSSSIYQQLLYTSPELEEGEHIIKVTATGRKNSASTATDMQIDFAKVYHSPVMAQSITLSRDTLSLREGMNFTLSADINPANAENKEIVWESLDEEVATVADGVVTAIKVGSTTIKATVKDTNIAAECIVNVMNPGSLLNGSVGSTDRHYLQTDYDYVSTLNENSWSGTGWIGDILNSEIVLWTNSSVAENVQVIASDFTNEDGNIISTSNVEINFLKYVSAHIARGFSWGNIPGDDVPREMVPDVIFSDEAMNIEAQTVQPVWVQINIPKDAKPGIYEGEISVSANGLTDNVVLNYSFEVLDVVQPSYEETEFHLDLWQYPYTSARYYGVEAFSEKHFEILKPQMEIYRDTGGKVITTTIVEDPWNQQTFDKYPSMVKWTRNTDGIFEFDYNDFDKWVEFNMELGINKQINCYSIVPWNNRVQYFDEATNKNESENPSPGSDRWIKLWTDFLNDFIEHLDEKGWFDLTYIAMDERSINDMTSALNLIESITNKDGNTLKISGAMNYNNLNNTILDRIADISINLGHINHNNDQLRELSEYRRELGLNTTIYTCVGDYPSSFTRSKPVESAWTIWYAASQNADGFLRWAFDAWVEDPLTTVDHWYWESGDPFFVYPDIKDSENPTPKTSPRFEMLAEGIRDVEKLNYIKREMPELEGEITELLESVQRAYGKTNSYGAMESGAIENDILIANEVKRLKEGTFQLSRKFIELRDEAEVPTEKGDFNKDGIIDIKDLAIISKSYGEENLDLDINEDDIIDELDINYIINKILQ